MRKAEAVVSSTHSYYTKHNQHIICTYLSGVKLLRVVMATYFTLPQGMFFSISNWTVTLELVKGKAGGREHFTVHRHRFL